MATYIPVQSITLTSAVTSVTISNIPQTYTDLVLVANTRDSRTDTNDGLAFRLNEDSSSLYSETYLYGDTNGAASSRQTGQTFGNIRYIAGGTAPTGDFGVAIANFSNYSNTTLHKTIVSKGGNAGGSTCMNIHLWRSTAAISSITFYGGSVSSGYTLAAGSTFDLYGIKAGTPKAIGGDVVTTDGTYWYHAFKTSGIFTVQQGSALTADVLAVAGGGAGFFGGGGAGGVLYTASQSFLPSSSYAVTVGAGGAAPDPQTANIPVSGNDSLVTGGVSLSLRAYGGGGGGVYPTLPQGATGANGGSGGGAGVGTSGSPTQTGGSPVSGQGFRGGNTNSTNSAAGGGGAGAAGTDMSGSSSSGTNGGIGTNTYSSWLTATGLGVSGYIAGGGGGRGFSGRGTGGTGGGGNGDQANSSQGSAGTANTGGGGGGGYSFAANGYAGGSGLVIVRYAV